MMKRLRRMFDNRVHASEVTTFGTGYFRRGDRIQIGAEQYRVWNVSHAKQTLYVW